MITGKFKTIDALDKAYQEHIESLEMWGGDFDKAGLLEAWQGARVEFLADHPIQTPTA